MIIFVILIHLVFLCEVQTKKSIEKISVMYSDREPFVIEKKHRNAPGGLDVTIMENFAKKLKLKTEYIRSNQSLNLTFFSEDAFINFTQYHTFE